MASIVSAVALAAAVLGRGCAVGAPAPTDTVRALIAAVRTQDRAAIFELLGPETRLELEARARAATDLVGSNLRYAAVDMIGLGGFDAVAAPGLRLVEERDGLAVVEISGDSARAQIHLVKVGDDWRIELVGRRGAAANAADP